MKEMFEPKKTEDPQMGNLKKKGKK